MEPIGPVQTRPIGHAARTQQDRACGALEYAAGRYQQDWGAQHIVSHALRRGIGDAYAAFVGQVDSIKHDEYGLALYALDRTYNKNVKQVWRAGATFHPASML